MTFFLILYLAGVVINAILAYTFRNAYKHDDRFTWVIISAIVLLSFCMWLAVLAELLRIHLKHKDDE